MILTFAENALWKRSVEISATKNLLELHKAFQTNSIDFGRLTGGNSVL